MFGDHRGFMPPQLKTKHVIAELSVPEPLYELNYVKFLHHVSHLGWKDTLMLRVGMLLARLGVILIFLNIFPLPSRNI